MIGDQAKASHTRQTGSAHGSEVRRAIFTNSIGYYRQHLVLQDANSRNSAFQPALEADDVSPVVAPRSMLNTFRPWVMSTR